jgi:predicted nucleic acid-binding protein
VKRRVRLGVFVDTAYWVARLNSRDALHLRAMSLASQWTKAGTALVSSDAVLLETANFFARSPLRATTITAIRTIRASPCEIEPLSRELMIRAERRYEIHADKQWSLTDCASMEIMEDRRLVAVATTDHHFTQAGFEMLMG